MRAARPVMLVLLLATAQPVAPLVAGCGGCPWTEASAVVVSPATECLEPEVPDDEGGGGCVDPELRGVNDCNEPLVLEAATLGLDADVVVPPGESFSVVIPLELASVEGHEHEWLVAATLGDTSLAISFSTR